MLQAIGIMAAVGVGVGLVLSVLIAVPAFIYVLPYTVWLGWNQGTKGIPRKQPSDKLSAGKQLQHNIKNATKLYRSWITHTPHGITDW